MSKYKKKKTVKCLTKFYAISRTGMSNTFKICRYHLLGRQFMDDSHWYFRTNTLMFSRTIKKQWIFAKCRKTAVKENMTKSYTIKTLYGQFFDTLYVISARNTHCLHVSPRPYLCGAAECLCFLNCCCCCRRRSTRRRQAGGPSLLLGSYPFSKRVRPGRATTTLLRYSITLRHVIAINAAAATLLQSAFSPAPPTWWSREYS